MESKVLMIASGLHRNGTERFMMNVLNHIDRSKISIDFLLYEPDPEGWEEEAKSQGSAIYFHHPRGRNFFAYRKSLKEFFRENASKYNAVHYNGSSLTDIYPLVLAKKHGIPVRIVHSHSSYAYGLHNRLLHKFHKGNIHKTATHFFACSDSAANWAYGDTPSFEKRQIVANGISLEAFAFNQSMRKELREELNIPENALVVANTATFRPVKNHPFIIEVFEEIHKKKRDAVLVLCGAGGEETRIRALVEEKKLTPFVRFVGVRDDINRILSGADVLLFPSFYEGLPFSLIEAQASGIPIFASNKISQEIQLTNNIHFLPLEEGASQWAQSILDQDLATRKSGLDPRLSRYDIKETVKFLSGIYTQKDS